MGHGKNSTLTKKFGGDFLIFIKVELWIDGKS
jgi:hypothetical protein